MKICDLTQSYNPTSGGIRTFIHEKRNYIQQHENYSHILIVPGPENYVCREERLTTYTIKSLLIKNLEPFRFLLRLDRVLDILKQEKPDIVEIGDAYLVPWVAMAYRRFNPQAKIVGYYHTDFPTAYVEPAVTRKLGKRFGRFMKNISTHYARFIYCRCDATLTASTKLLDSLKKSGIHNVHLTTLGVDTTIFHPDKKDANWRRQFNLGDDDVLLFYHGRMDSEKRVDHIVKAFNRVDKNFKGALMLLGEGPMKPQLFQAAAQNKKIFIQPFENDRQELARCLASADVYVTAGPYETFGLSVLEAQSCGLPVIGVNAGALQERVNTKVGALVQPDDVEALADKIYQVSTNGFHQKGKNARKMIEADYTWKKAFEGIFTIYEKILEHK